MKVLVFESTKKVDNRVAIYGIPFDKIYELRTLQGGHNVICQINGIETSCSFDKVVDLLGERVGVK